MYLIPRSKSACSFVLLLLILSFVTACKRNHKKASPSGFTDESFSDKLEAILKPVDTTDKKKVRTTSEDVRYTYELDEYQPIWIKENYLPGEAAEKLIAELEDMRWDGIDPERYNLTAIKKMKQRLDTTKDRSVADAVAFDTAMTHSYLAAAHDLLIGYITPKAVDSLWYHVNDTVWNGPASLVDKDKDKYTALDDYRSDVPTYALLRSEYKHYYGLVADTEFVKIVAAIHPDLHPDSTLMDNIHTVINTEFPWIVTVPNDTITEEKQLISAYQLYSGIKTTGKLDSTTFARLATPPSVYLKKLSANMERIRWMQKQFGSLYVIVDVPLMQLFLRKEGANLVHMNVVVGKPERQTPSLFATMANIVINPTWGVPPTILKQDVVPGFAKSGKKYLDQKGLKAYDKKGKVVNASRLTAKNLKNYTYKQDAGDDNSLGYVKFNLPNPWDIYLHDTPHRGDFGKSFRALSSGCIRLQYPQEMAIFILSELEGRNYTQGRMDTLIETHKTRWEVLKTKIPVHIAYLTAFEDTTGKHVQFTRDIYHRDDKLISALK